MKKPTRARVMRRIRLLRGIDESNASPGEARAAARLAQKLIDEYHVELDELHIENARFNEQIIRGAGEYWQQLLLREVARHNGCKAYTVGGRLVLAGSEGRRMLTTLLFQHLRQQVKNLAEYDRGNDRDYRVGVVMGISEALRIHRRKTARATTGTALVEAMDVEQNALLLWVDEHRPIETESAEVEVECTSYAVGFVDGLRTPLNADAELN